MGSEHIRQNLIIESRKLWYERQSNEPKLVWDNFGSGFEITRFSDKKKSLVDMWIIASVLVSV